MDDKTTLPLRPRLRASVDIAQLDNEHVLIRGHQGTVALSGAFVTEAMPDFLVRLDGERTLDRLFDTVATPFRAEAEHFLRMMQARGYLATGPKPEQPAESRAAYWAHTTQDAAAAHARLAAARVALAGNGAVADALAGALADLDVGHRTVVPRSALLEGAADAAAWQAAAAGATLMVLASDGMSLAGVDVVNAEAIRRGVPWLLVRIDRARALIGPYVIPGQTACFACYERRARANAERPADHAALHRHWRYVGDRPADAATPPGAGPIVGGWAALDLGRAIAGGGPPITAGRIVALDLHTLQSTTHEILRLPRCEACSRLRTRPLSQIWDIPTQRAADSEG